MWMSEGSDEDYKPTLQGIKPKGQGIDRPKRATRREVDYRDSGVRRADVVQGQGGNSEQGVAEGFTLRETRLESVRELRGSSTESVWGGSTGENWSPQTITRRTSAIIEGLQEVRQQITMAKKEEMSMVDLMKLMVEMSSKEKEDARIREEEREERAIIREEKRLQDIKDREEERRREENVREERREAREVRAREEAAEREIKMLATLKAAQPAVPQTVHLDSTKLPVMSKGEDLELFIELFESALTAGGVPEGKWVPKLHAALDTETKLAIKETITNPDATYEQIKQALVGQTHLTFAAASESLMTLDQGSITKLPMRQAVQKLARLFEKATAEATTLREMCLYSAVAVARFALNREPKQYIDVKGTFEWNGFCRSIEEWQQTNPGRPVWDSWMRQTSDRLTYSDRQPFRGSNQTKKQGDCYFCGKPGHYTQECRTRLNKDKPLEVSPPQSSQIPKKEQGTERRHSQRPLSETTCFNCHQKGHISPNCPTKCNKVKRVKVDEEKIERLKENEVFGAVGPHRMPVTLDTGAEITVVPEESVDPHQLNGETRTLRAFNNSESLGKVCRIEISVGDHVLQKQAVTQPGASLGWSACLSFNLTDPVERDVLTDQISRRAEMTDRETLYVPPEVREGMLVSGIPVKEAKVVKKVKTTTNGENDKLVSLQAATAETQQVGTKELSRKGQSIVEETVPSVETEAPEPVQPEQPGAQATITAEIDSKVEEVYVPDEVIEKVEGKSELSLEKDEVAGDPLGGSAETEGPTELPIQNIREGMPLEGMVADTKVDPSLTAILKLASLDKDGYHMSNGLIFRTRLDVFGTPKEQLCVPQKFRRQCLQAAHTGFGHQGRNRMVALLRQYFYWPCMGRDCVQYVRACNACQQMDKTQPRPPTMTERQVVTKPFTDVSIDIVGPFPTAKGGFKFMLTLIDTASRWPEAFPICSTTSKTIIRCLTTVFTRWGFPEKLTSDNGSQFTSTTFTKWLRDKGITHARSTPYHPQGNGIVERLHRTLNGVVAKTIVCKGDWAAVLPMALFFLRCTPTSSTGLSPFLITHGWEPSNPIQLLYKSWVDTELGGIDLAEWVLENADRVESAREKAMVTLIENSRKRADEYNKKAKDRHFVVGDRLWVRRPGLDHKLTESWAGPGTIVRVNSPVSFRVQTQERLIPTINIQQLKLAKTDRVKKISAVVEDTETDKLSHSFASADVESQQLTEQQQQQLQAVLQTHSKILTKDPGLTSLIAFDIDTGDAEPIQQRPYSTPVALKTSVDEEITWLLGKGFIVPSSSPWASPMVTVRKADGSARLCVDFRRINGLACQTPFFMPRVDEVIEGTGRSKYISKLDLSKGFYQVPLTQEAMPKTAFTCHRGAFHFTRMPFGVKNAPACFQSLMQRVLAGLTDYATAYMDDVVIFSQNWDDHVAHISSVLETIGGVGLIVNPKKCCWGGRAVEFLGHFIGEGTMSIPAHRSTALANYTKPRTKKGLRAFLGSVGFYRRYLRQLANWTSALTPKTSKQAPQIVEWSGEDEVAFSNICKFFCDSSNLCVPLPNDIMSIVSDASGRGIGGILQVRRKDKWFPAAYFSRQLRGAEHRYSATELEALALTETIRHFAYHLYGRPFQAYMDHKPLVQLTTSTTLNPRLSRFAFKLQSWLVEIRYLPREENTLADALSTEERPPGDGHHPEEDASIPGRHLAVGDVEGTPPQRINNELIVS